jgi:hypothetical protein
MATRRPSFGTAEACRRGTASMQLHPTQSSDSPTSYLLHDLDGEVPHGPPAEARAGGYT